MIGKRYKIIILGAGLFILALHFTLVAIYANPFGWGKGKASFLAFSYAYPFFHQGWNLFAPVPDSNYRLLVRYNNNGPQWVDVFNEVVVRHQYNRLIGHEPLVIAFSNSIHYFEKNTPLQKALNGPIKEDLNFFILEQMAGNYLKYTKHVGNQPLKLILLVQNIHTGKQRVYFN